MNEARSLSGVLLDGEAETPRKTFLLYRFPRDKRKIAGLSYDQKMEWYAYQFQFDARAASIELSTPEFARFWKWRVLIPIKFKRFYYRVKNLEIFKHYQHISEMKAKRKGPERI